MKATKLIFLTPVIVLALIACGQKRPMETEPKFDHELVSSVKTDADFLYLVSVSDSDSTSAVSRPHWMSESKIVRYQFNKDSLNLVQQVSDPRMKDNPVNEKPVLSIPVEYFNYRCKENDFKECTNKEEKDDRTYWDKKKYFVPNYSKLELSEVSFLPLALDEISDGCYAQKSQKVVSAELKEDSLNIELEREYKAKSAECLEGVLVGTLKEYLDNFVFKVRYHISVVKLSSITDNQYQEVNYPRGDDSVFGFFSSQEARLDIDNRPTADKVVTRLHRWSPNRKEITYYLNAPFERVEYAKIKDATLKVADAVSNAFKEAGANIKFKVKQAPAGMSGEDLRYSQIIMVPESMDSGLLGYGPSATNPKTGEIVHGRVVMYLGNMKTFIYRTWDEVVAEQVQKGKSKDKKQTDVASGGGSGQSKEFAVYDSNVPAFSDKLNFENTISKYVLGNGVGHRSIKTGSLPVGGISGAISGKNSPLELLRGYSSNQSINKRSVLDIATGKDSDDLDMDKFFNQHQSLLEYYSNNNYYPADYFNFENAITSAYKGKIPERLLKPWVQLTEVERAEVIDIVLPITWTTTLIHEIGHTLGLRHNFSGSEDKENFYSEEELKKLGIEHPIHISSVMEYPFEDIGALPVMGKYDIAALKFGYARKVDTTDGKTLDVGLDGLSGLKTKSKDKGDVSLKKYRFCTDEHTDVNPGCKRFDTGTTLTEIAQHQINIYETFYKYRNYRNGRRFFNITGDAAYFSRMFSTLKDMRMYFERYEDIKRFMPDVSTWQNEEVDAESREFLKDLSGAVNLVGNHYLNILSQPDVTCVYKNKDNNTYGVLPLVYLTDSKSNRFRKNFNPNIYSCSRDLSDNEHVEWVGQFGRYFNSKKDPQSGNPYVDEIDVRGIMIDKILASHFLLSRSISSGKLDETSGNFLDVPEIKERIIKLYFGMLLDEVPVRMGIPISTGEIVEFAQRVNLAWTHTIQPSASPSVNRRLRIFEKTPFAEMLLRHIDRFIYSSDDREDSGFNLRLFQVSRNLGATDLQNKKYLTMSSRDGNIYYIFPENILADSIYGRWQLAVVVDQIREEILPVVTEQIAKKATAEEANKAITAAVSELKIKDEAQAAVVLKGALDGYANLVKETEGVIKYINSGFLKQTSFYEDLMAALPDTRLVRQQLNINANIKVRAN